MTTAPTSTPPTRRAADALTRVCDLNAHPVPTFVCRSTDERLVVLENLSSASHPTLTHNATAVASLQHPNVSRVRQITPTAKGVVLVSDYIPGESLAELERLATAADIQIPLEVRLRIVVDVLSGLSALHGHLDDAGRPAGLVHRHVHAANVVVGLDGGARLVHLVLPPDQSKPAALDVGVDVIGAGALLEHALHDGASRDKAWAVPLAHVAKRAAWPVADAGFASAAAMAAEVRLIAKARLATPAAVAALVHAVAGERIQERTRRLTTAEAMAITPSARPPRVSVRPSVAPRRPPVVPRRPMEVAAPRELATPRVATPPLPRPVTAAVVNVEPEFSSPQAETPGQSTAPTATQMRPETPTPSPVDVVITAPQTGPPVELTLSTIAPTSSGAVEMGGHDTPATDPGDLPFTVPRTPGGAFGVTGRGRARVVLAVLGAAVAILLVAAIRTLGQHGDVSMRQEATAAQVERAVTPTAIATAVQPAVDTTPAPTTPDEPALPTVSPAEAESAVAPTAPTTAAAPAPHEGSSKPRANDGRHEAKPAATYDPLGI